MQAKYDEISNFYTRFVRDNEQYAGSVVHLLAAKLLVLLGDIQGQAVCDLACGEGHLSRAIAQQGANVVGIDISVKLLAQAREQAREIPNVMFTFSLLHPCFEPPFQMPDEICVLDEQGDFSHLCIKHYLREGYWQSGGDGIRGRIGAYHRMLSTYTNDLLAVGFQIAGMHEPTLSPGDYNTVAEQWLNVIPRGLIIQARKGC